MKINKFIGNITIYNSINRNLIIQEEYKKNIKYKGTILTIIIEKGLDIESNNIYYSVNIYNNNNTILLFNKYYKTYELPCKENDLNLYEKISKDTFNEYIYLIYQSVKDKQSINFYNWDGIIK